MATQHRVAQADTTGCEACRHCRPSMLFTLCTHPKAGYVYDGKADQHTIQHMRDIHIGLCGADKQLFQGIDAAREASPQ
jgi:hypothetical protein